MGYSEVGEEIPFGLKPSYIDIFGEVLCHICGVSFNIGRIRTPSEPRSAAWSRFGPIQSNCHVVDSEDPAWARRGFYTPIDSFVDGSHDSYAGECLRDAGCMFVLRRNNIKGEEVAIDDSGRMQLAEKRDPDPDDENDEDWEPQDEEENDPLEYDSDAVEEGIGESSDVEMEDMEGTEREAAEEEMLRRFWIEAMMNPKTNYDTGMRAAGDTPAWLKENLIVERVEVNDSMYPLFVSHGEGAGEGRTKLNIPDDNDDNDDDDDDEKLGYWYTQKYAVEHIAGPRCIKSGGYSGHNISVEEMRGCQVAQCLVRKPEGWTFVPAEDDEDFEKEGAFFLSGLIDHMPSRDSNYPQAQPPRHGCDNPHAENIMWDDDHVEEYAMPFHPWCFEVFKRASLLKNGYIDVHSLTKWWTDDARKGRFDDSSYGRDVAKCRDQEWLHVNGTEYLAANPLYVPKLRDILQEVTSTDPDFSPRNSAFYVSQHMEVSSANDPFTLLPAELRFKILDSLTSCDIGALRLVSRAFRQIPIWYFQKLLNRQMPWLWEAWPTPLKPDHPAYSFWATVTAGEAVRKLQHPRKEISYLNDFVNIVGTEIPDLKAMLEEALPGAIQKAIDGHQLESELDEDRKPFFLPPGRTDYHLLYVLIKRHWKEMRGLRNRMRIWKQCRNILKQAEKLKTAGEGA